MYLLFKGGGLSPDKFNIGEGAEAGLGIQPSKFFAAETSFGFMAADDYDDDLENQHTTVQMLPVTGTIRAILPIKPFDVYALAGGGLYYTMLKIENKNKGTTSLDDNRALLGYHYGGGASLQLGGSSSIGIELRRIEAKWDNLDLGSYFLNAFFRLSL